MPTITKRYFKHNIKNNVTKKKAAFVWLKKIWHQEGYTSNTNLLNLYVRVFLLI